MSPTRGELQIGAAFLEAELTELQSFALDKTYQVEGIEVTVRHFERIAARMNQASRFISSIAQAEDSPLPLHGKMPALDKLLASCYAEGIQTVGCFASHGSNWTLGVPILGAVNGLSRYIIVYATNPRAPRYPDWLKLAQAHGAEIHPIRPNMTSINSSQAKTYVQSQGGYFIPFGLETLPAIEYLTEALAFPDDIGTLVLCAGSGITLSGVLLHLKKYNKRIQKIVAVSSGRPVGSIQETVVRVTNYVEAGLFPEITQAPFGGIEYVSGYQYSQFIKPTAPWETHPYYERKVFDWLSKNIKTLQEPVWFLNMGI